MKYLGPVLLLLILSACSEGKLTENSLSQENLQTSPIIGGIPSSFKSTESRFSVLIALDSEFGETSICSGTFISNDLILTAAHCVSDRSSAMQVLYGHNPFSEGHLYIPIIKAHLPPPGQSHERRDIALIQFSGGLPEGATTLSLAKSEDLAGLKDFNFTSIGYGRSVGLDSSNEAEDGWAGSGHLRSVVLQTEDYSATDEVFGVNQKEGKGVCFGDSGGPALMTKPDGSRVIVGIASGVNEDTCSEKSVFMNILGFREWIFSIQSRLN